jgi:hypothetical protein
MFVKGYNLSVQHAPFPEPETLMGGAVVAFLASLFELVSAFALTELIRVVTDIERSARRIADR